VSTRKESLFSLKSGNYNNNEQLLFTINIPSYKGLHDCVKEVKNLEQLKEREETEVAFVE
jgi:hypothetical protein